MNISNLFSIVTTVVACSLYVSVACSQTASIDGNQYAFTFSGNTNAEPKSGFGLYFNQNNPAPAQYEFLNSSGTPIFAIGAVSGHTRVEGAFSMGGNINMDNGTTLRIRGNNYAFQYYDNPNYGLYFSTTTQAYHFTGGNGLPVFTVNANSGDAALGGGLRIGNSNSSAIGYMRVNNGRFEGHDGANWKFLDNPPGLWLAAGGTLYSDSSIGIGTSTPAARLQVEVHAPATYAAHFGGKVSVGSQPYTNTEYMFTVDGHALFTEATVKLRNNWPDYVFHENYELTSLDELESFIENYGHLPEIPAAKDVEEAGIELGEMNRLLMQKIEELTLYTINQEKRIKELEAQIVSR